MNTLTRILVIDDEEDWCFLLKFNLEKEGFDVDTANSAEEALTMDLPSYQLIISDVMMDQMSGFDLVKRLKYNPATESIPVILCTALDNEDSTVKGLNIGADDYITKPFVKSEVIARVKAVLRRARPVAHATRVAEASATPVAPSTGDEVVFKTLRLDRNQKACYLGGEPIDLKPTEYELLLFFLTHRNKVYSREEIISQVWQGTVSDRAVDTNITRIRKKLGPYGAHLKTKTGFGYAFQETL